MAKKPKMARRPLAERITIARRINEARDQNPYLPLDEILKQFPGISDKNYWAWKRLAKNADKSGASAGPTTEHFPLVAIPEPRKREAKLKPVTITASGDQVTKLLDVILLLLERKPK